MNFFQVEAPVLSHVLQPACKLVINENMEAGSTELASLVRAEREDEEIKTTQLGRQQWRLSGEQAIDW